MKCKGCARYIPNGGGVEVQLEPVYSNLQAFDIISFNKIPAYKDRNVLHQKYIIEGLSLKQIAREILSSKCAVKNNLIKFNIPLRTKHRNPANPNYGSRYVKNRLISHLQEQRVIMAISDMKNKGLSLTQIAKYLTAVGVPTKRHKGKWGHQQVQDILERN